MVFRIAKSEFSNRHAFDASVRRRALRRRLLVSLALFALAFSSSWVVLLAIQGVIPLWLGAVSGGGSLFAMMRTLVMSRRPAETKPATRHRLRPTSHRQSEVPNGAWIGRNILPAALILRQ
jgi:hypothetical protein